MKTKLPIIAIVAILVSACTTGTQMTKNYDDDIYFSPGDVPPIAIVENKAPANINASQQAAGQQVVTGKTIQEDEGSKYVPNSGNLYGTEVNNSELLGYGPNNQDLLGSDTTVYYDDDDVKYVINNYYDDMDYANRFNRFYGPYYSPYYYDDWYYGYGWGYPYWGLSIGFGWGYPYYGWGYPYYGYGWGYPYYGYGDCYPYGGYYYDDVQVERRRTTNMNASGNGLNTNSFNSGRSSSLNNMNSSIQSGVQAATGSDQNSWIENGHSRSRTIDPSSNIQDTKKATVVNDRRPGTNTSSRTGNGTTGTQVQSSNGSRTQMVRQGSNTSQNARRSYAPSTSGSTYSEGRTIKQSQNYTPSYNKPRIVNQSNYNNSYTRPRTSGAGATDRPTIKSANPGSTYTAPKSSSSMRQTYRSSSSYSSGSSSSTGRNPSTYRAPSSSTPSYSAPSRSSSGSYSGGGSSGGGYSGGGGSGHRR